MPDNYVFENQMRFDNLRDEDKGKFMILNRGEFKKPDFENLTGMILAYDGDKIASGVSSDKISIYGGIGDIFLERYYKNDWEGMVVYEANYEHLHVFTLDCRNIIDQLDKIKSRLEEQYP